MRTALLTFIVLISSWWAAVAQRASEAVPPDNSPVSWFLDKFPIPTVTGTGIRTLRFYENVPDTALTANVASSSRLFVLRKPGPPLVEMEYDSIGQLIHAVYNPTPITNLDQVEVHWWQAYDDRGNLIRRVAQRIDQRQQFTISVDTTFFTYDRKGRCTALRIPHRPWVTREDTILVATDKLTEFRYNHKGQLSKLIKRCDPSEDRPSGMLVVCARDSFLYDAEGKLAEILSYNIREWQVVRHFLYDGQGRLKETAVYAGLNPSFYLHWRYDGNGQVVECRQEPADGFGSPRIMTFEYGPNGILKRYVVRGGTGQAEVDWVVEGEI